MTTIAKYYNDITDDTKTIATRKNVLSNIDIVVSPLDEDCRDYSVFNIKDHELHEYLIGVTVELEANGYNKIKD